MKPVNDSYGKLSIREARALARALRGTSGNASGFLALIDKAKAECGGQLLRGEDLWHQVAWEMAALDGEPFPLKVRLQVAAGAVLLAIATVASLLGIRWHT